MSLHIITGLPRNGKSFYCCTRILDDLENTDRFIYTNLPVNPDMMARLVAVRKRSKSIEYLDLLEQILKRIRVFRKFNTRAELLAFRKKNPVWCKLNLERSRGGDFNHGRFEIDVVRTGKLLYTMEQLSEYWNYTKANSIFYFDECYQIWNCLDASERGAENKARRKELQNYMRMHGHDGDDIFLISHKERDLDKFILDTCSYRINVRNSKYWPIIPQEIIDRYWWLGWLGSLRWPVQFFILRTYIGDEQTHHKTFYRSSKKYIFRCYDSMSRPNGLKSRGFDSSSAKSSDINNSWFREFRIWFFDSLPALVVLTLVIITICGIFSGIRRILNPPRPVRTVAPAKVVKVQPPRQTEQGDRKQEKPPEKPKPVKVVSVSPRTIYYENGTVLRVGGDYEYKGSFFEVVSVSRDWIVFRAPDGSGKLVKVKSTDIF